MARIEQATGALLWIVPAAFVGLLLALAPAEPILYPDSGGYIHFSALRTAGYPLLLDAVEAIFGGLSLVPLLQVLLFAGAAAFFGYSLRTLLGKNWPAVLIQIGALANPFMVKFHYAILTDSIFFSLAMLHLSLLIHFILSRRWRVLAWCGLVVGVMTALRPVGYAWIALMVFLVLVEWRRSGGLRNIARVVAAIALPLVVVLAAESLVYRHAHGDRQTLLHRFMFGKGAILTGCQEAGCARGLDDEGRRFNAFIESDLEEVRSFLGGLDSFNQRSAFLGYYEVFLQFQYLNVFQERSGFEFPSADTMMEVGVQRIRSNLPGYLGMVWVHYLSSWNLFSISHPGLVGGVNAITQGNPPPPFSEYFPEYSKPFPANPVAIAGRPLMQLLGVVSLGFALGALGLLVRPHVAPRVEAALYAGLTIHGYFLLVALVNIGSPRYLYPVWAHLIFTTGVAGLWALDLLKARYDKKRIRR